MLMEGKTLLFSELADKYEASTVRVYLVNGASLKGKIHFLDDGWVEIINDEGPRALCNLSHVVSISSC